MNRILIVLLAALTFFSCKKETSTEPSIQLTSGSTDQTVYADQTTTGAGQQVKFSTKGPWHAEVSESIASKAESTIDWVTPEPNQRRRCRRVHPGHHAQRQLFG